MGNQQHNKPGRRHRWALPLMALALLTAVGGCETSDGADSDQGTLVVTAKFVGTPVVGQNVLDITVANAAGEPVTGATITVDPQMPAHGHGSTEVAKSTGGSDGTYNASPVTLQMKGFWQITVKAAQGGETGRTTVDITL